MKKIICILGSAIFLVLLVLPCFGISKAESDEIWKMKVEYDQTLSGYSENGLSYIQNPFYSSVDSLAYVFLCTPTASSMKFTAVSTEEDPGGSYGFLYGGTPALGNICFYNEALHKIFEEHPNVPKLYAIIQAFGISKEELKNAQKVFTEQPEKIRKVLPDMTDEQFASLVRNNPHLERKQIENFMVEALFLGDEEEILRVLTTPWSVRVDGKNIMFGDIISGKLTAQDLTKMNIRTRDFLRFVEYCKDKIQNGALDLYWCEDPEIPKKALEELSAYLEINPPETGDNTLVLLTVTALSVLGICALAVTVGRKKKERF